MTVALTLGIIATLPVLAWLGVLLHPARAWDLRPVDDEGTPPPDPANWPPVVVLVPARNEAEALPQTLPALLGQRYPGSWRVVLVDDRSADGTGALAARLAADIGASDRLEVIRGTGVPPRWVGKVWALEQGARHAGDDAWGGFLLLTDADILHASDSLRRLVAEAQAGRLALVSRMARLRCRSRAERLLVPPFVLFFNLLDPMRRVNRPRGPAAAAGGCVLVRRRALAQVGGFAAIRGALIDDLALARRVKGLGRPIRLTLSRGAVRSVRAYGGMGPLWTMVRRSAFTQLRGSWALLAGVLLALVLLFAVPVAALVGGIALILADAGSAAGWWLAAAGAVAWALMAVAATPSARFFGLGPAWRWTLPAAGLLYAAMTLDSALRGPRPGAGGWR